MEPTISEFMDEHYTCHDKDCTAAHVDMDALEDGPQAVFTEVLGKQCNHEVLDEKGRCKKCGVWAVLTGRVPVANPKRTRHG